MTKRELRLSKLAALGGVSGIADKLFTSVAAPQYGIGAGEGDGDYDDRRRAYGTNVHPRAAAKNFAALFWGALQDTTLMILIVSAVVSLVLGIAFPAEGEEGTSWIEGAAILLAVLAVSMVTAGNDWNKERQFRALSAESALVHYEVWRGGRIERVLVSELLVGDVVVLSQGDKVPADGLFVDGRGGDDCMADESVMTGESEAVLIDEENPVMLSGTLVQEGLAHMLVLATGSRSQWGELLANLGDDKPDTPLQVFLDRLAVLIGYVGLTVAAVVFLVMCVYWAVQLLFWPVWRCVPWATSPGLALCVADGTAWSHGLGFGQLTALVDFFIIAVTIVVVAVPEGLPLAVTISLAYSMRKMMKDNNLVRHLDACETMGGCTAICSDKTGTLTENRMTVVRGWAAGRAFGGDDGGAAEALAAAAPAPALVDLLCDGIAVNSKARFEAPSGVEAALGHRPDFIGSKTECALLVFADHLRHARGEEYQYQLLRQRVPTAYLLNFTSDRKRMSTIVRLDGGASGYYRMFTKGAAEIVLDRCESFMDAEGQLRPIDDTGLRAELEAFIVDMAGRGLRTLALAFRDFPDARAWELEEDERNDGTPEHNLVLVALVGIEDPVREEVPGAVAQCQGAGIIVRMVTGDNLRTACKIASECGIYDANATDVVAMEGEEFRRLGAKDLDAVLPRLRVLARSSPLDKKVLVEALMARGEVVAVTGDGTNDAPALKKAHVGLSMGIAGTEVAKEASDIVLLDDNFRSIVAAVMWGRCVYDNIRKFLQFQLTVNLSALAVAAIGAVTNRGTPLTAIQLLWVNLVMDTLGALGLSVARPLPDLLDRAPYGLKERFISNTMARNAIGQGVYQVIVLCALLYLAPLGGYLFDTPNTRGGDHYTVIFNTFIWMQLFNQVNSRVVNNEANIFRDILHNWSFIAVLAVEIAFQLVIVEIGIVSHFLGTAFSTTPLLLAPLVPGKSPYLGPLWWLASLLLGATSLVLYQLLRLVDVERFLRHSKEGSGEEEDEEIEGKNLLEEKK